MRWFVCCCVVMIWIKWLGTWFFIDVVKYLLWWIILDIFIGSSCFIAMGTQLHSLIVYYQSVFASVRCVILGNSGFFCWGSGFYYSLLHWNFCRRRCGGTYIFGRELPYFHDSCRVCFVNFTIARVVLMVVTFFFCYIHHVL